MLLLAATSIIAWAPPAATLPPSVMSCLEKACPSQIAACQADATCAAGIKCMLACPTGNSSACVDACIKSNFDAVMLTAGLCAQSSGCLSSSAAPAAVPTITIAPGVEMPLAGLGTWQYNSTVAKAAVLSALKLGYTHIDTALGYDNQDGVGEAIAASGVARDALFVTSKIPGGLAYHAAGGALTTALDQLFPGDDGAYVDLMLVHFPASWDQKAAGKALRQDQWRALEAFHKGGKARAIGVSHYCKRHIDDILEVATVTPAINQVQFHVGMGAASPGGGANATDDREYDGTVGVTYQSFSPLCGPCEGSDHMELITGDLVTKIGKAHGKSGAQVALKWQVQQNIPVIPKSANPDHQRENLDLFGWTLSDDEMRQLSAATKPQVAGDAGPGGLAVSGDCSVP